MSERNPIYDAFYRFDESDFVQVEIRPGDEIAAIGDSLKYGAIPIKSISLVPDSDYATLFYTLPVGALSSSSQSTRISVFWSADGTPDIHVVQEIPLSQQVLIKKK